ncbi:FmdB family zinc ribbon protein [Desulfovibrio sp.]
MPIFEYKCGKCGQEFEELVFGEETPACPKCGSAKTSKLMSRCRAKSGGEGGDFDMSPSGGGGGGCSSCSGGSCSTCGH